MWRSAASARITSHNLHNVPPQGEARSFLHSTYESVKEELQGMIYTRVELGPHEVHCLRKWLQKRPEAHTVATQKAKINHAKVSAWCEGDTVSPVGVCMCIPNACTWYPLHALKVHVRVCVFGSGDALLLALCC